MKIGIVGLGGIVPQCLDALERVKNCECAAICVREPKKAQAEEIARQYNFSKVYTDYEKMLLDDEIEFIYVGIINSLHYEYTKKALEFGKNVITEKPFTSTDIEAKEIIDLAKQKNLFVFEAITVIYSPNYRVVQENMDKIGDIKLVQCNFSQYSSRYQKYIDGEVMPAFNPKLSGGALYDINIYNIHFVVGLFGEASEVRYIANLGHNGIDTSGIVTMKYENFIASLIGAKDSSSPNYALVQGTKGYIKIDSSVNVSTSVEIMIDHVKETISNEKYKNHMVNEFIAFEELFRTNNFDQCYKNLDHSFSVIKTAMQARKNMGILFEADRINKSLDIDINR